MRILFDHSVPAPLRHWLRDCTVTTAAERGGTGSRTVTLLDAAEESGFDILLTSDKGFQYQQNLTNRRIAVVILNRGNWPEVEANMSAILEAIGHARGGACTFVRFAE